MPEKCYVLKDYRKYRYNPLELIFYSGIGALAMGTVGWVFYQNYYITVITAILGLFYPKIKLKKLTEKHINILRLQFKDMLYYLGSSLSAGRSVESAFAQVYSSLKNIYPDDKSDIVRETEIILKRLRTNENIENILKDFANRSGIEEIHHFADVFSVCRRSGGNLIEVVRTTSRMISERIEIKQEIETNLAGKKQEQRILTLSPILMVIFISKMSGEFIQPLFSTEVGRVVMTISLLMIGIGIIISNRIMDIHF
ncbi:MAG: type II secretion system F family protein [Bacillota bacterium]|jgi:tight adherence protein B|nr:type II secretion system F family protein [Bacillota bacterium]